MAQIAHPVTLPTIHHDGPHTEVRFGRLALHFCKQALIAFAVDGKLTVKQPHSRSAESILAKLQGKGPVAESRRLDTDAFNEAYEHNVGVLDICGFFPRASQAQG